MTRARRKVVFLPRWNRQNPYQNCLASALEKQGFEISIDNYPNKPLVLNAVASNYPDAGVIHLHWIAPLFNRLYFSETRWKAELRFFLHALRLWCDIQLAKLRGVKVVWTVHNLLHHESKNPRMELKFRRVLARHADLLCFHSKEAQELVYREYRLSPRKPFTITQHACYEPMAFDDAGVVDAIRNDYGLEREHFVFLFFGQVRKYKGLKSLIEAFTALESPHVRLVVAGHITPSEEEWVTHEAAQDPRIVLKNSFLSEQELAGLIQASNIVVLPYARTLSSGSALMAISYGKPLVLPETARVIGVPGDRGAIYFNDSYTLREALEQASSTDLSSYGDFNRALSGELTWEKMVAGLQSHYLRKPA